MASGKYNRWKYNNFTGNNDLVNDTIKVALMDNNHSFSATDNEWTDVSANEISGAGYAAGGQALSGKSVVQGSPTVFDASDIQWTGSITAYHAVLYNDSLTNDDLIVSIDFGGVQTVIDGTFVIQWSGSGIIDID